MSIISRVKAMSKKEIALTIAVGAVAGIGTYFAVKALMGDPSVAPVVLGVVDTDALASMDTDVDVTPTSEATPTA